MNLDRGNLAVVVDAEDAIPAEAATEEISSEEGEKPHQCHEIAEAVSEAASVTCAGNRRQYFSRHATLSLMISLALHGIAVIGLVWWVETRVVLPHFAHSRGVGSEPEAPPGTIAADAVPGGMASDPSQDPPSSSINHTPLAQPEPDNIPKFSAKPVNMPQNQTADASPLMGVGSPDSPATMPVFHSTRPALTTMPTRNTETGAIAASRSAPNTTTRPAVRIGMSDAGGVSPALRPPRVAVSGGSGNNDGYDERGLPIPDYPAESKRRHEEGMVELDVEVLPDGKVGAVRVLDDGGHHRLADAAVASLSRARRFVPATLGGIPVSAHLVIPYRFTLQ